MSNAPPLSPAATPHPALPHQGGGSAGGVPPLLHFISTMPTSLARLLASSTLPSRVTSMLRTMSPPRRPGIAQVWNFSVLGSKRTMVFGLAYDSQYHSAPLA